MIAGESPVRVWRGYRGLGVKELADKAGVSAPYISQIEGGVRTGSTGTMRKIAEALGVDLDDLV